MSALGALCVPPAVRHNIRNAGDGALKPYTINAPDRHPANTVHVTKADAVRAEGEPSSQTPR